MIIIFVTVTLTISFGVARINGIERGINSTVTIKVGRTEQVIQCLGFIGKVGELFHFYAMEEGNVITVNNTFLVSMKRIRTDTGSLSECDPKYQDLEINKRYPLEIPLISDSQIPIFDNETPSAKRPSEPETPPSTNPKKAETDTRN